MQTEICKEKFYCSKINSDVVVTIKKNYVEMVAGGIDPKSDSTHVNTDIMNCTGIEKNPDGVSAKCGINGVHMIPAKPIEKCIAEEYFQPII